MKKTIVISLIIAFAFALSSSLAFAAPAPKVEICHITDSVDIPQNEWTLVVGHTIEVSVNSAKGHIPHGDFLFTCMNDIDYGPVIFGLTWRQIAENWNLKLSSVDCAGFVHDSVFE